jgi:multidrug efflux pump subunit AcrB
VVLLVTPFVLIRTPTDIFPNIAIPVVSTVWNYGGLSAPEMANRIVSIYERAATITVNDIEHIESQSLAGIAVVKIFFQPKVKIDAAVSQVTAIAQTVIRQMPPGTTPPLVIVYNASTVPVLQLALAGQGLSEQQLFDVGNIGIRTQLATVEGAAIPYPYGGKQRQVQVDLDLAALQSRNLAPSDVVNALSVQNLILPTGTSKIGLYEYSIETNSSPTTIQALNDLPIRAANGAVVFVRDVAQVRDGYPPQTNIVRVDGQRAALMSILKTGAASTLDIIKRVREVLAQTVGSLPPNLKITPIADQSLFVRASIQGVVREALIAACLTGLMILLFLGSWRSTLIIAVSIPLSILMSLIVLSALGETINIMTLGGFALAVGILVDDATVEIENINRNRAQGKEILQAILDGAAQIAVPAFVSTLAICIVFVPMFFLTGVARYLFVPLAEAVCFALLSSYFLSRTLVPTMARFLLSGQPEEGAPPTNVFGRVQRRFEHWFERRREVYRHRLERVMSRPGVFAAVFLAFCAGSAALLVPWLGRDFFPAVDSGQIKLHLRARTGTRIEETARLCDRIDNSIRTMIPPSELETIIDNIGLPYSGINLSYSNSAPVGTGDADIFVTMKKRHRPVEQVTRQLRNRLSEEYPGATFYFLPVDMVSQILNFGLSAPIDVQIVGNDLPGNRALAERLLDRMRRVPGAVDLRIQQSFDAPRLFVDVDRSRAEQIGYNQRDVAGNLLIALSGSAQVNPTYWLDPRSGVTYSVAVQAPQYQIQSFAQLRDIPVTGPAGRAPQILGNLATITRGAQLATVSHYNTQPVIDIFGAVDGTDLGSVAKPIDRLLDAARKELPRGSRIIPRGQILTMRDSYRGLLLGLGISIVLVYMLIVVNFQSWLDPLIIISALPAAIAGIVWLLFLVHTRLSVPALTGAIMCMGVATANSILVVSFAKERLAENHTPCGGGGARRLHPIPARDHDGPRDDHRHGPDVAGPRRGRGAERPAGKGGHRRAPVRYRRDSLLRPGGLPAGARLESEAGSGG